MKIAAVVASMLLAGLAVAQEPLHPVRFRIRHADPWFVKAMLEGRPLISPEISTLMALTGAGPFAGAAVNSLFQGGTLMVNAADNSLWFIPSR